jgi:hypothetical protein
MKLVISEHGNNVPLTFVFYSAPDWGSEATFVSPELCYEHAASLLGGLLRVHLDLARHKGFSRVDGDFTAHELRDKGLSPVHEGVSGAT